MESTKYKDIKHAGHNQTFTAVCIYGKYSKIIVAERTTLYLKHSGQQWRNYYHKTCKIFNNLSVPGGAKTQSTKKLL